MFGLSEVIKYRYLLRYLIGREINSKYKGSTLGFAWSLLNPLLNIAVYSVVFSVFLRINIHYFSLYLLSGLLPWMWFQQSIASSAVSLIAQSNVIKKVAFPREVIPLSTVVSSSVNFLLSMLVLLCIGAIAKYPVHWSWALLPVVCIPMLLLLCGLSLFVSVITSFFRDIEHLINVIMFAWLYLTPIMYQVSMVPKQFKWLTVVNPMTWVVQQFQRVLYYGEMPSWGVIAIELFVSIVVFLMGLMFFRSAGKRLAEVL